MHILSGSSPAIPLQDRTPQQLRAGLTLDVRGGEGDSAVPLARLMQDAAQWKAGQEHTDPSLATVQLHDKWGDRLAKSPYSWLQKLPVIGDRFAPYQAFSDFDGSKGHLQLSDSQSTFVEAGIAHLHKEAFNKWNEVDQSSFIEANATILHELGHLTLKNYSTATINEHDHADLGMEEGLAELLSVEELPEFVKHEYGIKMDKLDERLQTTASVYTPYTARMRRLFELSGVDGHKQVLLAARLLSAGVTPAERPAMLASEIAGELAGKNAPKALVDNLAEAIPSYLNDSASNTTMRLVANLRDHAS